VSRLRKVIFTAAGSRHGLSVPSKAVLERAAGSFVRNGVRKSRRRIAFVDRRILSDCRFGNAELRDRWLDGGISRMVPTFLAIRRPFRYFNISPKDNRFIEVMLVR
jgi:hypothetical protein